MTSLGFLTRDQTELGPGRAEGREVVLEGRDIVCFSNDWNGDPYSKTHLMRRLARNNRVLWVNSIGSRAPTLSRRDLRRLWDKLAASTRHLENPEPNLYVLHPLAVPLHRYRSIRTLNGWLLRRQVAAAMEQLRFREPISWVFVPWASVVAGRLGERLVIYHCVDEFTAFQGVVSQATASMEEDLLRRADLVIVSSETLQSVKSRGHPRVVLVRHGVDFELFRRALDPGTAVPEQLLSLPRPVLGFFGLVSRDWIDLPLLHYVAKRFSNGSLVLLGSVTCDVRALAELSNVHFFGRRPYTELPAWCKGFDVALIPFVRSSLTEHCNPLKVWQYLAAGLPVVSTPIPEVQRLSGCRIADDGPSFVRQIKAALEDCGPSQERSEFVRHETWDARIEEIKRHIQGLAIHQAAGQRRVEKGASQ